MDNQSAGAQRGTLIVTGAVRGIGAATALLAAARGYKVAVNYAHDTAGADGVARAIAASDVRREPRNSAARVRAVSRSKRQAREFA